MSGYDIASRITLMDMMTPTLATIVSGLESVMDNMEMVNASSKGMVDIGALRTGREAVENLKTTLSSVETITEQNSQAQELHNNSLRGASGPADNLLGKVKAIAATYISMQGIKMAVGLSDETAMTKARINELTGDLDKTRMIQEQIYNSAMRSRAEYGMTGDIVSKLGMQAGHAFDGLEEAVAFSEQLQKRFKIAGTDAMGVESVMYNLTQAMSAGVLRGQDLNSVLANAPSIAQDTAKYMGYTVDQVKALAEEGQLTAQVVKEAMLATADETNAKFENIPMTFADMWVMSINIMQRALEPVLERLNEIINTEQFQEGIHGIVGAVTWLANVLVETLGYAMEFAGIVSENWSWIAPIVMEIVAALLVYQGASMAVAAINGFLALSEATKAAAQTLATGATLAATAAQHGLNAALLASPITWIIMAIIGVIAVLYAVVGAINKVQGTSISATGIIVGVLTTALAFIGNLFVGLYNAVMEIVSGIYNGILTLAEFIANVFNNPLEAAMGLFISFGQGVLGILKPIARILDAIIGTDITGFLSDLSNGLQTWKEDNFSDDYIHIERWNPDPMERFNYGDAYNSGYGLGANLGQSVSDMFNPNDLIGGLNNPNNLYDPKNYTNNIADTAANTGKMAKDTSKISETLDRTNEELNHLKELATARAIDRFSVDKIDIRMENAFGDVNSDVDLDGYMGKLLDNLEESVEYGIGGAINV